MLRKIVAKGIILNSLHFAYPLVPFPQTQFASPFYSFSNERPAQNNSKPLNHPTDKSSTNNTSSTKSSEPSDNKSESDVSKKRQKVSYRKVQKQKDKQIAYIIRQFRESIQEEKFTTSKFSKFLKELADQYRQERHQQFLNLRQQLEKLTDYFDQVNFKTTKLQDLLNILDFIRIVTRLQTFNKRVLERSRTQVMEAVSNYLDPLEKVQTSQLMVIFCKISSMPFAGLHDIAINLHDRLVDMANSQQGLTFSVYQLFILMKSLSKKDFLSHVDKRILQIVLVIMGSRMGEIDVNLKFQIIKALIDMKLWANIADNRLLSIADQIFKGALAKLKKGNTLTQLQYISQCPVNDNQDHKEMARIVFHRLVTQIESKASNFNPLRIICNCLKHISVEEITSAQKSVVMSYIAQLFEEARPNYRKELQNILLELLQSGFLGREVSQLNQLMAHPHFDLYWTYIYEYSSQGLIFPAELLVKKIHSTVHTFKPELTFVKMAYAVAIQAKLQPQNESITNLSKEIVKTLSEVQWEKEKVQWLTKLAIFNPKLVRNFHQHYAHIFEHRIKPSQQNLKQEYSRIRGEKLRHLDFWQYLFATAQFDQRLPAQMLLKMPITAITLPVSRQLSRISNSFDHKTLLLAALLSAFQTSKSSVKDTEVNQVIQLLVHFQKGLGQGIQSFDQLYWLLCDKLVRSYTKLPKYLKPLKNFLLMLLLNIQRPKVRNSIHYRNFLNSLLTADGILTFENEYSHLKVAISRAALSKNMFSEQYLPRIDRSYLSTQEQNIIKAMIGEFKFEKVDQQSLKLLFRTVKAATQTLQLHIANILQTIEQSKLQSLQTYLMFFSNESSQNSDRILTKLVKEYTRKFQVGETDFLGVIYNIKNLKQLESKLINQLFNTISRQLVEKMNSISLADHLYFLREINQRGFNQEEYQQKLLTYSFEHPYRGILAIDIAWQLCRDKLNLNKEQFQILTNYATFNPDNYLKLLVLHENILPQTDKLVAILINNQSKLVSDDLFLKYINQKYEQFLKKTNSSEIVLHQASEQSQKMLTLLSQGGVQVKSEEVSIQKVYIINEKALIAFTTIQGKNYTQVIQNILGFLYPNFEIILCLQSPGSGELSQLLSRLSQILHLAESLAAKIKVEMALV